MNINLIYMVWCFIAGMGIGMFYFAGLWWSLKRLSSFQEPALWLFTSFLVRSGVSLAGFYLVSRGGWKGMLFCLFGFFLMRMFWVAKYKHKILSY